jgi:hypothetical protein
VGPGLVGAACGLQHPHSQSDAQDVGILQRSAGLDAAKIGGGPDVVVVGLQYLGQARQEGLVAAGEDDTGLASPGQLAGDAWAPDGRQRYTAAELRRQLRIEEVRQDLQIAFRVERQPLGDRKKRHAPIEPWAEGPHRPFHASRAHSLDDQGYAIERLIEVGDGERSDVLGERPPQFRMPAGNLTRGDDVLVQVGADEPHFVTAIRERPRHRRPHEAGPDDRHLAHAHLPEGCVVGAGLRPAPTGLRSSSRSRQSSIPFLAMTSPYQRALRLGMRACVG